MCWITNKKAVCQLATKNIEIFKIMIFNSSNTVVSYYQEFKYKLNKAYDTKELEVIYSHDYDYGEIYEGFHSYASDCTVRKGNVISVWNDVNFLDSYNIYSVIVKGYIPVGAHYYLNERGEYVSDEIYLTEIKTI